MTSLTFTAALITLFLLSTTRAQNINEFDHQAHAVPGGPYIAYDHDGTNHASVVLDGSRSHTHYYDPTADEFGTLVSFRWTLPDHANRVICETEICARRFFPLGTYKLKLTVTDSTGDIASGTSIIRILEGGKPAIKYLFYPGIPSIPQKYDKKHPVKASLSQTARKLNKWKANDFLAGAVFDAPLSLRVFGEVDVEKKGDYRIALDCGLATCSVYFDGDLVRNKQSGQRIFTKTLNTKPYPFQITWILSEKYVASQASRQPKLVMRWTPPGSSGLVLIPASVLSHRPGNIQPVIHFLQPAKIKPDSTLTIVGSNFVPRARIIVGGLECKGKRYFSQFKLSCEIDAPPRSIQDVVVITPYGSKSNIRKLEVLSSLDTGSPGTGSQNNDNGNRGSSSSGNGGSNSGSGSGSSSNSSSNTNDGNGGIDNNKGVGYEQRVNFKQSFLQLGGKRWTLKQPTAVVRGPDDRYYFARRDGGIVVTEIDEDNVKIICSTKPMGNRAVLGLAFNPRDIKFKMYATASILDFPKRGINIPQGWKNGQVVLFEKSGDCIKQTKTIISGLPVSAFDHAVNKMAFDSTGGMYISVGSNTNAGIPSKLTLNLEDSRLSSSILFAKPDASNFDGTITYKHDNRPGTAIQNGGDVSIFATGVRNSFGLLSHSSGLLYATDNGGNQAYGPKSTGCNSQTESQHEVDKLLLLKKEKYYGAANRARGGKECIHYSVTKGNRNRKPSPSSPFEPYLTTMDFATTGIAEFSANTFGGTLRGNLMLSQIATGSSSQGSLSRVKLTADGKVQTIFQLNQWGGADIAISGEGNLIMPRVYQSRVAFLKANERNPGIISVTSVWPFKGPSKGGNTLFITGWNLGGNPEIFVGGKPCTGVKVIKASRKVSCKAPSGTGKVKVIARNGANTSGSAGFEYIFL